MIAMADFQCRSCGAVGRLPASDIARGRGQFCSRRCSTAHGRAVRWAAGSTSPAERLDKFVIKRGAEECWGWSGFKHKGYGRLRVTGNKTGPAVGAHRVSYEREFGPVPDGLTVLHRCDNPECTNPRHLFVGTNEDNNADRNAKGRQAKGESHSRAVLSDAIVLLIRASQETGPVLGKRYGVTKETIYSIKSGRTWRHLKGGNDA